MPELPEVEITARRLSAGWSGAKIEPALAPGLVALKPFAPPLDALAGAEIAGVRRIGKMLAVDAGGLTLLVHLMSAGRLQLFDARASLRDRSSRILVRIADGRELRLREFGTQQRAWAKLLRSGEVAADEAVATLGPDASPAPPPDEFARLIDQPRHLHPLLRDQRTVAGIGRSWVDEILWTARLSPFQRASDLDEDSTETLRAACNDVLGGSPDPVGKVKRFHDKQGLNFTLLADEDHEVAERYGVWVEKARYGKTFWGVERTTFLLDEEGRVMRVLHRVKPTEHDRLVLDALSAAA